MFDIGFAELLIIGVVALIVIGPERLPDAIRTLSAWVNRFRRGFNDIKQEVQQELHNDAIMRELRESSESLRRETENLRKGFNDSLNSPLNESPLNEPPQHTPAASGDSSSPLNDGPGKPTPDSAPPDADEDTPRAATGPQGDSQDTSR
jgi:sec-independent protein translocase protein TatB